MPPFLSYVAFTIVMMSFISYVKNFELLLKCAIQINLPCLIFAVLKTTKDKLGENVIS